MPYLFLLFMVLPFSSTPVVIDEVCILSEEKKLYEMINDYRKKKRLSPIPFSAKLTLVAQTHARDLANNYQFDKNNICNPHSWSAEGSWSSCCYTADHKEATCMWDKPREIANYDGDGYEIAYYSSAGAHAQQGLIGWQKSPSHNPLLVNSGIWKDIEWNGIGIGIYKEYAVVWFGQLRDDSSSLNLCANH